MDRQRGKGLRCEQFLNEDEWPRYLSFTKELFENNAQVRNQQRGIICTYIRFRYSVCAQSNSTRLAKSIDGLIDCI